MDRIFENKIEQQPNNEIKAIRAGKFKVILPRIFGFCGGVVGALKRLENIIEIKKKSSAHERALSPKAISPTIYLLGEIIHNSTVNQMITSTDVRIIPESRIESVFEVAKKDDYIVIPAFGIPLDLERKIRKQYKNIVDTTCKNVKSVWTFISAEAEKGATILLYGKPGHPEVRASISRADKSNCVIILSDLDSARHFAAYLKNNPFLTDIKESDKNILQAKGIFVHHHQYFNPKRFALANQTTMLFSETKEVESIVRNAINTKYSILVVSDTICNATYLRQQAAIEVCKKKPDLIMVVGGYDSSNTTHLYKLAKQYAAAYYIKDADSINASEITHFIPKLSKEVQASTSEILKDISTIIVLAGASCPFTVINQIIKKLGTL